MVCRIPLYFAGLLLVPAVVEAQLSVLTPGYSLDVGADNSTSYIQVTGGASEGRCEPNQACAVGGTSRRVVYDNSREKLVSCNGVDVTHDGAECSSNGALRATTHVRMGKLKISAAPAAGYRGLRLDTTGARVRLEFGVGGSDHWTFGYSNSNFGAARQWQNVPAGQYTVVASPLAGHCSPSQSNQSLTITVPEYTSEADQVELVVSFTPDKCRMVVKRVASATGTLGDVVSTPEGVSCAPGGDCTGAFAFDTEVTLIPSGGYSWLVGSGCSPTNAPCKYTATSDRELTLTFNDGPAYVPDAGVDEGDAAAGEPDAGAEPDADDAGNVRPGQDPAAADAGAEDEGAGAEDEGASGAGRGGEGEKSGGGGDGCAVRGAGSAGHGAGLIAMSMLALAVRRGRRKPRAQM